MLKTIYLLLGLACLTYSTPIYNDPCLYVKCPIGQICIKSVDGYSYNCLKETSYSDINIDYARTVKNRPVNYFEKYMSFNPCLTNPCGPRQICRNWGKNEYVCQSELELGPDTERMIDQSTNNIYRNGLWQNLKSIWNKEKSTKNTYKITLKAKKQNLRDEDYIELSPETIKNKLGDICVGARVGQKIRNPSRLNQYVICLKDTFVIRNCPRGMVFNTFSKDCEKTLTEPNDFLNGPNPCQNNSTFVSINTFEYRCDCPPGFTGKNCEKADICEPSFCGMTGVCLSIGHENIVSHMCWCDNGLYIGQRCEKQDTLEPNPCLNLNSGQKFHKLDRSPSVYVQCGEENKPILETCEYPLVFSETFQECDWPVSR